MARIIWALEGLSKGEKEEIREEVLRRIEPIHWSQKAEEKLNSLST